MTFINSNLIITKIFIAISSICITLSGCVNVTKDTIIATQSITTQTNHNLSKNNNDHKLPAHVAVLPFVNHTKSDEAFDIVRKTIFSHFASKNYQTIHLAEVDRRLQAASITTPDQINSTSVKDLIQILGVDGLLYGDITHYNRTFLGIYAQVAVGVRIRLVNQWDEEIFNKEKIVRKHEGGISTTPTGIILQTIAAAMHIRQINLFRAADELGRTLMAEIPEPQSVAGHKAPVISQIVHDGAYRILKYGDTLSIALEGTPGAKGSVNINGLGLFDLEESTQGMYQTKIPIHPDINIKDAPVVGILQDDLGGKREFVSSIGLVTIDNIPPDSPTQVVVLNKNAEVRIDWHSPNNDDILLYQIQTAQTENGSYTLITETHDTHFVHKNLKNFTPIYYHILTIDHAKHASQPIQVSAYPIPDNRFESATPLTSPLPDQIKGIVKLTAKNSPYHLNQACHLSKDSVLLIESGVVIQLSKKGVFKIEGELQLFGSEDKPVIIIGKENITYKHALILMSSQNVYIRHTIIKQGDIPIVITKGSPNLMNCQILNSVYSAIEIQESSKPMITQSVINGSHTGGIIIMDHAQPQLNHNQFIKNKPFHIQSSSPYLINARDNSWDPEASSKTILGNVDY